MLIASADDGVLVHAPAKVNLFLELLGKRSDGYHELETLMTSVSLYDTLTFTEDASDEIRLQVYPNLRNADRTGFDSAIPDSGADNLVVRAALALRQHTGISRGARIRLWKRIPVAAGLAGGSSDAAATLMALNRLWQLHLSRSELMEIGSQLGSDIPFFLGESATAICRGRGERVEPLNIPLGLHLVIVRPPEGLSTAAVFQQCRPATQPVPVQPLVDCLRSGRYGLLNRFLHNRLQEPAEQLTDHVVRLRTRFSQLPVVAHLMSGSGSACFGICPTRRTANAVGARLRARGAGCVLVVRGGGQR